MKWSEALKWSAAIMVSPFVGIVSYCAGGIVGAIKGTKCAIKAIKIALSETRDEEEFKVICYREFDRLFSEEI